jgi:hypothetical protein
VYEFVWQQPPSPMSDRPPEFLTTVLQQSSAGNACRFPRVTLTFAQSLDGKIAGKDGEQLILSGKESMIMTHWCVHSILSQCRVSCNHR